MPFDAAAQGFKVYQNPLFATDPQPSASTSQPTVAPSSPSGRSDTAAQPGLPPSRQNSGERPAAQPADRPPRAGLASLQAMGRQAGAAVINSSPVQGLASLAVSLGNAVAPPAARTAVAHASLLVAGASPDAVQVQARLQGALSTLGDLPAGATPAETRQAQNDAHAALVTYGNTTSTHLDRWVPVAHKAALVGVAGAGMAFGVGRSSGIAGADAALRHAREQEPAPGFHAPGPATGAHTPPAPASTNGTSPGTHAPPPPLVANGTSNGTHSPLPPVGANGTSNSTHSTPPPVVANGTSNSTISSPPPLLANGTSSGPGRLLMGTNSTAPGNTRLPVHPGANHTSPPVTLSPPGANNTSPSAPLPPAGPSNASTSDAARPGSVASTSAPSGIDAGVNALAQTVMGAAVGGVGNFVGQTVVAPLVNRIQRQSAAVDVNAVVPDEMVALMNQLRPGSGTALRKAAQAEQTLNSSAASARNVAVGRFYFDAANAVRAGVQGYAVLGAGGTIVAGTAVSVLAGSAIGATMAINASLATLSVPDMVSLREQADLGAEGRLDKVATHEVPLFFTRHMGGATPPFTNPVADPSGSLLATAANTVTSIAGRAGQMLSATTLTGVVNAVTPAFVASMPEPAQGVARAGMAAIGIHQAIEPWFNSLATDITTNDTGIVAGRRATVDAARAARRAAPEGDVELGEPTGLRQRRPHTAAP